MEFAFYDLDGTITRRATYTPFLWFAAGMVAPVRRIFLPAWIGAMIVYKLGIISRGQLKSFGMKLFVPLAKMDRLPSVGEAFATRLVERDGFNKPVVAQLERDRKDGRVVVVATAAFAFYAGPIARRLGIADVIGTRWQGRAMDGANCYGTEKLARVEQWLAGRETSLDEAQTRMISDSFADRPLMARVDEAVFVTASVSQAARAKRLGWSVLHPLKD